MEFYNVSAVPLCGLRVASTHPDFFTFGGEAPSHSPPCPSSESSSAYQTFRTSALPQTLVSAHTFVQPSDVVEIPLEGSRLGPGESTQLPLWLRGPDQEGVHEIHFLFYYENVDKVNKRRRYEVFRLINMLPLRCSITSVASRSLSSQTHDLHFRVKSNKAQTF